MAEPARKLTTLTVRVEVVEVSPTCVEIRQWLGDALVKSERYYLVACRRRDTWRQQQAKALARY